MRFEQIIDGCLTTGGERQWNVRMDGMEARVQKLESKLDELRRARADGSMPHLALPGCTDDLDAIGNAAAFLRQGARDIVILGTGGSSLGAQALAQVNGWQVAGCVPADGISLHFLDNLDPVAMQRALSTLDPQTTRVFAVSKSGGTAETLIQTLAFIAWYEGAGLGERIADHVLGLSEPRRPGAGNALRECLEPYGVSFLEHDPDLGGRYSVLSAVGLVPAALAGLDVAAVRKGAAFVLDAALDPASCATSAPVVGAALNAAFMAEHPEANISVLWAYSDSLRRLTAWWVQLWAESLGKDGKGTTPLAAVGPVDQHSQQQLYLGGPRDKLVTFIETSARGKGPRIEAGLAQKLGAASYAGKAIGDLTECLQRATMETLAANGIPVRRIHIDEVNAETIGALLMHFMLETILTGHLIGVDPFDQPAVEEGKVLARKYLAEL